MSMQITPLDEWISRKIGLSGPLSQSALADYQLEKVNTTLNLASKASPFYREKFKEYPTKLGRLEDLSLFPFTTSEDIRASGQKMVCVSQDAINRVVTLDTSGTTGAPKRLFFTETDQELTIDFFQVGMSTFTQSGDRVLILLPGERPGSVGDLLAIGLKRLGSQAIPHGVVQNLDETVMLIRKLKVNSLVGIPNQVLALARFAPELNLKSVLLSTDHVPQSIVKTVAKNWHCQVYNHYGMTEMGLGGGVECEAHRGYHLREADLFFEIIDPIRGHPLPVGEMGEVVFTTLTRSGMPLIRYRTGDLSRFIPEHCPCGSSLRLLQKIRTRLSGQISLGNDVLICLADLDEVLFEFADLIDFKAALNKKQLPYELFVQVVLKESATSSDTENQIKNVLAALPAISRSIQQNLLRLRVGASFSPAYPIRPQKRKIEISETPQID